MCSINNNTYMYIYNIHTQLHSKYNIHTQLHSKYIYIYIHPGHLPQEVEVGTPLTMQHATSSVVAQWLR